MTIQVNPSEVHIRRTLSAHEGGYTLVELTVIITIIGILTGMAVVKFSTSERGAIQAAAHKCISDIAYAQEMAMLENRGTVISFFSGAGPPGGGGGCFVASACYGGLNTPPVRALRGFRYRVLLNGAIGGAFVAWYSLYGPYLSRVVREITRVTAL